MTTPLTHPNFSAHLNTKFRVAREAQEPLQLELIAVSEFLQNQFQDRFSIKFRGPADTLLEQGMYAFEHEAMGNFRLFIVPIDQKEDGYYYEAVFNRLRK